MATPQKRSSAHQKRDIVVIGASSGGVAALLQLVSTLPANFPAPIFVVQHMAPYAQSVLPQLMSNVSPLPAKHPLDGETVRPGTIYVAPPDHHLLIEDDKVLVKRGPKENRFRPSVDALFRSAAYGYGPRVIGVVLTGYLDDGTSGLWCIQRLGGVTVVQDPEDAASSAMPTNALEFVEADHVVPLAGLSALLVQLTAQKAPTSPKVAKADVERMEIEFSIAKRGNAFELGIIDKGELTPFTCPDCHGALTKLIEGKLIRFRCHTGHAYTISALLSEVSESVESMLYQSMRGLEESKMLLQNLGEYFAKDGQKDVADTFFEKATHTGRQARLMHDSIFHHEAFSGDTPVPDPKLSKKKKR
jgi:two-component system chemotaxis response regulator CheB